MNTESYAHSLHRTPEPNQALQALSQHRPEYRPTAVHYSCSSTGTRQAPGQEALNTYLQNCPSQGILIFIAAGILITQEPRSAWLPPSTPQSLTCHQLASSYMAREYLIAWH
ncbi:hypothetical protein E2C01_035394 [Portunus trituberculatus]|uniref:Uncharacterized protein n=1 Tax=Portunus trituberculatus TaxID=210409 RepID=A0A5B7F977_PORTR|nr:hypothetical protein [Portunus trituberculatus]